MRASAHRFSFHRFSFHRLLGSFFGLGLVPWAPGTVGSLGGILLAWLMPDDGILVAAAAALFVGGLVLAARIPGDDEDPGWFVIDEVVAVMLVPLGLGRGWPILLGSFLLFRLFDITKPPPIKRLERIPRGWGVMLDDVLAAVFAHGVLRLVLWLV